MANPVIKIKRSAVAGKIPTTTSLELGELAINTYDGKVFIQQDQGIVGVGSTVITINPWSVGVGSIAYNTYFTAGSVGIGTTNPPDKLTVSGKIQIQQDSGSNNRLVFRGQPGSSYRWNIDNYSSSNQFRIFREDDATSANGSVAVSISTTGTVTATAFVGDGSGLTNLPGGGGGSSQWITTNAGIHTLSNVGIGTTNPTSKLTVSGNASITGILTADQVYTSNNGNGQNIRIGDDFWLGDVNVADTTRFSGAQDSTRAFVIFGSSDAVALGRTGTGPLYYGGNFNVAGVITASSFSGNASSATYATSAGIATYATSSGIATYASTAGVSTYATTAGIATYATSSGIATYASVSGVATYATSAGIATYASTAGISTYATSSGIATYASTAGIATYATSSGIATYATSAGIATYASTAGVATALQNARTITLTGDVAGEVSFDGTANVSIAATIQPNSVGLGTDTTGDYVQSVTGTSNQITVTSGTGEGSTPTLSLPSNLVLPQDVTVTRDLQVNRNLNVTGNITLGGTTAFINVQELVVSDPDIILGYRTDGSGNDISNDNTANHGGIGLASTEGTPLVDLFIAGIESAPPTYKKIMWFKEGTFAGLGTDAWLINYAVGIGSTQFPSGTRLAAGNVQFTQNDLTVVRNINASGVITASSFSGNASSATYATSAGIATYASTAGISTVSQGLTGTPNIVVGIVTASGGFNLGISSAGTSITSGPVTTLNFIGAGNTFAVSGTTVDISIAGGGGGASISTTAPTSPTEGELWYNSNLGRTFIYYNDGDSSQWVDAAPFNIPVEPTLTPGKTSTSLTASAGQTNFTVSYTVGYIDVFLNGVRLTDSEYVASSGSLITLLEEAAAGDILDVVEFVMGVGAAGAPGESLTIGTRSGAYTQNAVGAGITILLRSGIGTASF